MRVIGHLKQTDYLTTITYKNNHIIVDEPIALGGQDAGMNPVALLGASLASCTCITIKMYANKKEWEIKDVNVEVILQHDIQSADITFHKIISITGSISMAEKERLFKVANSCPVNKILSKSSTITAELI